MIWILGEDANLDRLTVRSPLDDELVHPISPRFRRSTILQTRAGVAVSKSHVYLRGNLRRRSG